MSKTRVLSKPEFCSSSRQPDNNEIGQKTPFRKNSTAFVFPGQGSQSLGLLAALAATSPVIQHTFDEASEILGEDLWMLAQQGPVETLNQTTYTQPVLLTAGVAVWRLWRSKEGRAPDFLAGHSLGEYTALTCAESFEFSDAVALVRRRGEYMQEAVSIDEGAMAAIIGLNDSKINEICAQVNASSHTRVLSTPEFCSSVYPANYNMPGQVVISGHRSAVEQAMHLAQQQGAKRAKILPVSVPAHCALMVPAAERLTHDLRHYACKPSKIPVINNVAVQIENTPEAIKQALIKQLYSPVRWVESIQWLFSQGVRRFIECGPGTVLSSLIKRIVPADATIISMNDPASVEQCLAL